MSAPSLFAEEVEPVVDADGWATRQKRTESADLFNYLSRRTLGLSADWRWYQIKAVPPDVTLVTMARVVGLSKNGSPKWAAKAHDLLVALTQKGLDDAAIDWEAEHGVCSRCGGDGEQNAGVSARTSVTRYRYVECTRCHGTGLPKVKP